MLLKVNVSTPPPPVKLRFCRFTVEPDAITVSFDAAPTIAVKSAARKLVPMVRLFVPALDKPKFSKLLALAKLPSTPFTMAVLIEIVSVPAPPSMVTAFEMVFKVEIVNASVPEPNLMFRLLVAEVAAVALNVVFPLPPTKVTSASVMPAMFNVPVKAVELMLTEFTAVVALVEPDTTKLPAPLKTKASAESVASVFEPTAATRSVS